jgi:hypothetical protein
MDALKVGGEIEAFCPTCKTTKWQIIVALVAGKPAKLECIGCHRQHGIRSARMSRTEAAARPRPVVAPPTPTLDFDALLAGRDGSARAYAPATAFAVDDVMRHPSFGLGIVVTLPAPQKIEVQFRAGRKMLVHAQDGAALGPRLQRPARADEGAPPQAPPDAPRR